MEKKTMYVVVRFDKERKDQFAYHIYTKKHSNPTKMVEYKNELKNKYSKGYEWYVMPEEKAKSESYRYHKWLKENEKREVEQALRKYWFNDYTDRKIAKDLMENR